MINEREGETGLTAAVIGLNWGVRMHIPALRSAGWQVQMLCGRDPIRTGEIARQLCIGEFTVDIEEVFSKKFDLVVIALPWQLHSQVYSMALRSSAHILVEHPLATIIDDAEELSSKAARRHQMSFTNFPTRYLHPVMELQRLVSQGWLGAIGSINHQFHYPVDEEPEWLSLIATHSLDMADWIFGLGNILEVSFLGASLQDINNCPSWSWPILNKELGNNQSVTLNTLTATFSLRQYGQYRCNFGYHNNNEFIESFTVHGQLASAFYKSQLQRDNETSPWKISKLVIGGPEETLSVEPNKASDDPDAWFDAHVQQATRIAKVIRGEVPDIAPAAFTDAVRAHHLLIGAVTMMG